MRYHTTALFALALTLTDTADAGHTSVGLVVHEEMYELLDHLRDGDVRSHRAEDLVDDRCRPPVALPQSPSEEHASAASIE